ncbi:golD [Fragariocoptes setiger]|uniref:GolD n=1 Tax=Fragariocoptes setiger TaxID=1670756 RepID=A0ABQ7S9E0_9ACAR|nr:golD [Fragariocoptes setiger]
MTDTKVVIVTGSSSGIGEATAYLFANEGYHVVVTGSNADKVNRVMDTIKQKYPDKPEALGIVCDLSEPDNVESILKQTIDKFGRLDVLVNNAGKIAITTGSDPNSYEAYRNVMAVNLDSTVRLSLLAAPHLKSTKGNIVNVASVAATKPSNKSYAYCASKAAMTLFGKCLAIDLAPEVRVNNVLPGPVVTDIAKVLGAPPAALEAAGKTLCMTERAGQPHEVADAIYYLASDKAAFITGSDLVIDGGYVIKPTGLARTVSQMQQHQQQHPQ